jgi:hypothetical protein
MRWLVVGAFFPSPSGHRFHLTETSFTEELGRAASGLHVTVQDRIGSGHASSYQLSFDGLRAFQLSEAIDSIPALRALRAGHEALSGTRDLDPDETARLKSAMGSGHLSSAMAEAIQGSRSPEEARHAALVALEELLFATARDILQHPVVTRLESSWRGLHWLWTHCPTTAGIDIEVLDIDPHQRLDALARCLDVPPLQRPDACFVLDACDDVDTLHRLAALGEQASLPIVVAVPPSLFEDGQPAWSQLRADEASRWLGAALNPVVMMAEQHGSVRHECFTSPALAVAALLSASFRDTRTFARLVGPGSGTRAPAVWQPRPGSTLATEQLLSLQEQRQLAAQGLLGLTGWWDSDAVLLSAAPTVYGGGNRVSLPAQVLTGRLVRLAQELAERIPANADPGAVATLFSQAAEALPFSGPGRACQFHGRLVPTGNGGRGVQVQAALRPELAGNHVQFEFILPLSDATR